MHSTPEELAQEYEEMFQNRYTEDDPDYRDTVSRPPDPAPCIENWYSRPKRTYNWARDQGSRGRGGFRGGQRGHGNRDYHGNRQQHHNDRQRSDYRQRNRSYDDRGDRNYNSRGYNDRNQSYDNRNSGSGGQGQRDSYGGQGQRDSYGGQRQRDSYGGQARRDDYRGQGHRDGSGGQGHRQDGHDQQREGSSRVHYAGRREEGQTRHHPYHRS